MTKKDLIKRQIVDDLQAINPNKIIIFGSFSSGKFIEGKSDIDLLIIKESKRTQMERYSQARLSLTSDYPFDIFILTEKELREKLASSFFFREIISKGKVIYERK